MQAFERCLFCGRKRYDDRTNALRTLMDLREEKPELFSLRFAISARGKCVYGLIENMFEGIRQLSQFRRNSDDVSEIRRLSLNRLP